MLIAKPGSAVVIVGKGYVGLPRAVEAGIAVVGHDTDAERVKRLAAGESYGLGENCLSITPATSRGGFGAGWATRSSSSSWPTTSATTCRTTSCAGSPSSSAWSVV